MQELRKAVEERTNSSAQTAVEDSERVFTEMIRSIERRRREVTELIRAQEAEVKQAEEHLKQLEQEINELKQSDAELEKLTSTEDDIHFLENIPSIPEIPRPKHSMTFSQSFSLEALEESLSTMTVQLKEELEAIIKQEADTDPELPSSTNGFHGPKLGAELISQQQQNVLVITVLLSSLYSAVCGLVLVYGKKSHWKELLHLYSLTLDRYTCLTCLKAPEKTPDSSGATSH
ncbi:uncharacterized protein LOC134089376 [Sardina pilchardus]|uniref:uncharacterized protein LOC134089376 n=1 Tax=Sardina pilchardus TaxID=27697 RepID=UPI002E13B4D2